MGLHFDLDTLDRNVSVISATYNDHVARWKQRTDKNTAIDDFVSYDDRKISWSRDLKQDVKRENIVEVSKKQLRRSLYRIHSGVLGIQPHSAGRGLSASDNVAKYYGRRRKPTSVSNERCI